MNQTLRKDMTDLVRKLCFSFVPFGLRSLLPLELCDTREFGVIFISWKEFFTELFNHIEKRLSSEDIKADGGVMARAKVPFSTF